MSKSVPLESKDQLHCLAYTSFAIQEFSPAALLELLNKARLCNKAHDVSGMLIYRDRIFFQYIEGPKNKLDIVYARITNDPRHQSLNQILGGPSKQRIFPHWEMHYVPSDSLDTNWVNSLLRLNMSLGKPEKAPDEIREILERIKLQALETQAS